MLPAPPLGYQKTSSARYESLALIPRVSYLSSQRTAQFSLHTAGLRARRQTVDIPEPEFPR